MKTMLESIYHEYCLKKAYDEEENRISHNVQSLKESLNESHRKLLLRIQDDKNLIIERIGEDCFEQGMKAGVKLALEILYEND